MFEEDDLLPISALQHLLFCRRQCALIHLERLWADNRLTVEGTHLHAKADSGKRERRPRVRTQRSVMLRSLELGLWGKADVVEFLPAADGTQTPLPVEYKRGGPKKGHFDRVQLCAQAMCLEEMLGAAVPAGALFYARTRRREPVEFDAPLRDLTRRTAADLHAMVRAGRTPPAVFEKKCERCSLIHLCVPRATEGRSAATYFGRALRGALATAEAPASD